MKLHVISRSIVNGPKSNNYISDGIFHYRLRPETITPFLQTFRVLRMFKIVFRDSSLYPKQSPLFCLLRLISASTDPIGYISNLYSMVKPLHEFKNRSC